MNYVSYITSMTFSQRWPLVAEKAGNRRRLSYASCRMCAVVDGAFVFIGRHRYPGFAREHWGLCQLPRRVGWGGVCRMSNGQRRESSRLSMVRVELAESLVLTLFWFFTT